MGWLHRFLHPHCSHCQEERVCPTCNVLTTQLEIEQARYKTLLESILHKETPIDTPVEGINPISPRHIPWRVERQRLELRDRKEAQEVLRAEKLKHEEVAKEKIKELEEEMEVG